MILELDTIYFDADKETLAEGKGLFYNSSIRGLHRQEGENGVEISCEVIDNESFRVKINFDSGGGYYCSECGCKEHLENFTNGLCRHIVAAALCYDEKFPQRRSVPKEFLEKSEARTDPEAASLNSEYSLRRFSKTISFATKSVTLHPTLGLDFDGKPFLRLEIARRRKYLVKNIADFMAAIKFMQRRKLGAQLDIMLAFDIFDDHSKRLISFIENTILEAPPLPAVSKKDPFNQSEILRLSPAALDEFLSINSGKNIIFEKEYRRGKLLKVLNALPKISLRLIKGDGGYYIEGDGEKRDTLTGREFNYIYDQTSLFKVSRACFYAIYPLLDSIYKKGRLFVTDFDMPLFFANVLSQAQEFLELNLGEFNPSENAPVLLSAKMLVKKFEVGGIEAVLETDYDGEVVDIFSLATKSSKGALRDIDLERLFVETIKQYFKGYPQLIIEDEKQIFYFIKEGINALKPFCRIEFSSELKTLKIKKPPKISAGIRFSGGLLDLEFSAEGYSQKELEQIFSAYKDKRGEFIKLEDGSFLDLSETTISQIGDFFSLTELEFKAKQSLPLTYAPFLRGEYLDGGYTVFDVTGKEGLKEALDSLANLDNSLLEPPESLKDILRKYQVYGFKWLKTLADLGFGGILADDMGLGKSLQIISLIASLLTPNCLKSLIICPTSLVLNWKAEFNKFAPQLKTMPIFGTSKERERLISSALSSSESLTIITSYELLRRDIEQYKDFNFSVAVIDEAQYIKNPNTINSKAVKQIKADHRFALTGTPIENSLSELWSIFDFIMPGYLFSYNKFKERWESAIMRGEEGVLDQLKRLISPFILRRLKAQVLKELPPKIETDILVPLEDSQQKLYLANLFDLKQKIDAAQGRPSRITVLSYITRLRQIACDPRLLYSDYNQNSAKLETAIDLLKVSIDGGHKVLLFSQFVQMIEIIQERLRNEGISFLTLTGGTPKQERVKLIDKFNSDNTSVFLISLKAGGTGINLTGADVVMHYDPWWNESVTNQATDRAHRIGQTKSVQVYKLIMQNSVEEKILSLAKRKSKLSSLMLDNTENLEKLRIDELIALFD